MVKFMVEYVFRINSQSKVVRMKTDHHYSITA